MIQPGSKTVEMIIPPPPQTLCLDLGSGQQLLVERGATERIVYLTGSDNRVMLSIHLTETGPVLKLGGTDLTIQTLGNLAVEAERLTLHGRAGLALVSGADITVQAAGDVHSSGRHQTITASPGEVTITANDDVKLDGERIRMNC